MEDQLHNEGTAFSVDVTKRQQDFYTMLQNIVSICKSKYNEQAIPVERGICQFDLYILAELCKKFNIHKVTELGCGTTTVWLRQNGITVDAYSIGLPGNLLNQQIDYIQADVMAPENLPRILKSAQESGLILIDCFHSYKMAEYYTKNILMKVNNKILFIHDWFNRPNNLYSEQMYLWNSDELFNKYEHSFITDLPRTELTIISSKVGANILAQKYSAPYLCASVFRDKGLGE